MAKQERTGTRGDDRRYVYLFVLVNFFIIALLVYAVANTTETESDDVITNTVAMVTQSDVSTLGKRAW